MANKLSDKQKKNVIFNYKIELAVEIKVNDDYEIRWGIVNSQQDMDREIAIRAFIEAFSFEMSQTIEHAIKDDREFFGGKHISDERYEEIKDGIADDALFIDTLSKVETLSNDKFTDILRYIFEKANRDRLSPNIIIPKGTIFK